MTEERKSPRELAEEAKHLAQRAAENVGETHADENRAAGADVEQHDDDAYEKVRNRPDEVGPGTPMT